jgi:hypothetical protein
MAIASGGQRFYALAITSEDLSSTYDVEAEVVSQYGIPNTLAGDIVKLTISAVDVVAATAGGYAIDADGLNAGARLEIVLTTGALISGRGGAGGTGGNGVGDPEIPIAGDGGDGGDGGVAIRYGCDTTISGTGTVSKGYGAGGGGGAAATTTDGYGGGGGGGGVPLGAAGAFGTGSTTNGTVGNAATVSALGAGGAGAATAGDGGDGGESGTAQENGQNGGASGGTAGSDGDAIDTQTFSHSAGGGITIVGAVV